MEKLKCPEIRFKGFSGDWEDHKLSEIATMYARIGWQNLRTSEFLDRGDYMLITGTDFDDGQINYSTCHYVAKERYEQDRYIQIRNGNILITKDGTLGKVAYVQGLSMPATLNAGVFNVEIKDTSTVNELYLFQYLKAPFLMNYVDKRATGGTIKHLNQNILVDFPVVMPTEAEQTQIGKFFQNIDQSIALHQNKLNQMQNLKKAMLEKMFPKAGSKQPEIRLKGFSGEWELKSLSDVSEKFEYGLNAQATTFDGINKYIRITDIDDESRKFILDDITSPNICFKNCEKYKLSTGDILFARTGASVGKTYIYLEEDGLVYFAGFLIRAKVKDTFDANFIFTNTLTERFNKFVLLTSQRSGQPGINAKEYGEYEFYCPNKDEQESIGRFFRHLDETLVLQQQQLQTLKNLKQAFLGKMFV